MEGEVKGKAEVRELGSVKWLNVLICICGLREKVMSQYLLAREYNSGCVLSRQKLRLDAVTS